MMKPVSDATPATLFEAVACNLCGSHDSREKFVSPGWAAGAPAKTAFRAADDCYGDYGRVVQCRQCGLVFTSPRLAPGPLLDAYAQAEDTEYMGEDASRSINGHFSLNTLRQFVTGGRLLDVGCNTGYMLNAARLHFQAEGVEPSRWAAEFAQKTLKLDVTVGTLEAARFPEAAFDVVTLVDVIEHLPDPLATLQEIRRLLKPGGILYVVTPDVNSLAATLLRGRWWGLRPAHIYYFSRTTLSRMLQKAGFEVVLLKSYGRVFTLDYWLSRLRHYSPAFDRLSRRWIQRWGLRYKLVYVNTMDSVECCARKIRP